MEIREVKKGDEGLLADYYSRNYFFLKPWSPSSQLSDHSKEAWNVKLNTILKEQAEGRTFSCVTVHNEQVIAHCNLSQISKGAFQACYMGFSVGEGYQGKGIAKSLCNHVIHIAFDQLELHRIMANYMPHNVRSGRLLKKLGFITEGLAKDYLKINGRWENHFLTSLNRAAP